MCFGDQCLHRGSERVTDLTADIREFRVHSRNIRLQLSVFCGEVSSLCLAFAQLAPQFGNLPNRGQDGAYCR